MIYPADAPAILDALAAAFPALSWQRVGFSEIRGCTADGLPVCRVSMWLGHWSVIVARDELPLAARDRADIPTLVSAVRLALEAHHNQHINRAAHIRAALDQGMTPCG